MQPGDGWVSVRNMYSDNSSYFSVHYKYWSDVTVRQYDSGKVLQLDSKTVQQWASNTVCGTVRQYDSGKVIQWDSGTVRQWDNKKVGQ